jgi:hypothetical protein
MQRLQKGLRGMWLRCRLRILGWVLLSVVGCMPPLLSQTTSDQLTSAGLFWPGSTKSTRPNHVFRGRLLVSPKGGLAYEGRVMFIGEGALRPRTTAARAS